VGIALVGMRLGVVAVELEEVGVVMFLNVGVEMILTERGCVVGAGPGRDWILSVLG
jgi:hypothetical protein